MRACACSVCESFCEKGCLRVCKCSVNALNTSCPVSLCVSVCLEVFGVMRCPRVLLCVCIGISVFLFSFAICKCGCPSVVSRVCLYAQKPQLSHLWVPEEGVGKGCVCIWMCRCACVDSVRGTLGLRAAANVHTVFAKASRLLSWFCFFPPCGLWTLLANKGSLKNAALPVFPNVQNAAVNLNGASSDVPPCRCCRKPPASQATNTHLHNLTGGGWAGRGATQLTVPQLLS